MNFGFQEQRAGGGTIPENSAIAFNKQISNYDTTVSYNDSSFCISAAGDYYISWNVALKTGLGVSGPTISLVTGTTPSQSFPSTNSMKTGQISGSAILRVTAPTTFQLVNTTGSSIVLADNVEISANISIIAINGAKGGANFYLTNSSGINLAGSTVVPFNETVTTFNNIITNTDGVFDIETSGKYIVDWSVSLSGAADADYLQFNLVNVAGSTSTVVGTSQVSVITPTTIYGNALINIATATEEEPYVLQLVNASNYTDSTTSESSTVDVTLAAIPIQAAIRIVQI